MQIKEIYTSLLRQIIKRTFLFWEKLGIHITLNHFYEPIPDTRTLKNHLWIKRSKLIGINFNEKKQLELLSYFLSNYGDEYDILPKYKVEIPCKYYINNPFFGSVDGEILYCMIRYFKPKKIYEIGSGFSTYLSAQALLENKNLDSKYKCDLIVINPYPNKIIKTGFPGLTKLILKKVQDIPLSEFNKLTENDILFIDSSHVLKIGSDVQYEYLEILPRLNKGVIIHIHDIFLPAEYPKNWVLEKHRFWTEQYLLQAFLTFNNNYEILWAGSFMHMKYHDKLEKAFLSYKKDKIWPGSFWIRKK